MLAPAVQRPASEIQRLRESAQVQPIAEPVDERERIAFVLELARALHTWGTPAHRLEEALIAVSGRLGLHGEFFSTPTMLMATFGEPWEHRNAMIRVDPGSINLRKLAELDELVHDLVNERISFGSSKARLEALVVEPDPHRPWLEMASFAIAASSGAAFFGGTWIEAGVAGTIGLLTGLLARATRSIPGLSRLFEAVIAMLASVVAVLAGSWIGSMSLTLVTLAGLFPVLPGLTLTTAMIELSTRHLSSGTARLLAAVTVLLQMGFGVALGLQTARWFPPGHGTAESPAIPAVGLLLLLPVVTLALTLLFRARLRDYLVCLYGVVLAFAGSRLGAWSLGAELGAFVGAFVLTAGCNVWARVARRSAMVPLLSGVLLLVPGSFGFRSVTSLFRDDVSGAVAAASSMALIAMSVTAGMLLATAAVRPRRLL